MTTDNFYVASENGSPLFIFQNKKSSFSHDAQDAVTEYFYPDANKVVITKMSRDYTCEAHFNRMNDDGDYDTTILEICPITMCGQS